MLHGQPIILGNFGKIGMCWLRLSGDWYSYALIRSAIEEDYARKLQQLAHKTLGKDEIG